MTHLSFPAANAGGKQVAVVQPQRRETNERVGEFRRSVLENIEVAFGASRERIFQSRACEPPPPPRECRRRGRIAPRRRRSLRRARRLRAGYRSPPPRPACGSSRARRRRCAWPCCAKRTAPRSPSPRSRRRPRWVTRPAAIALSSVPGARYVPDC